MSIAQTPQLLTTMWSRSDWSARLASIVEQSESLFSEARESIACPFLRLSALPPAIRRDARRGVVRLGRVRRPRRVRESDDAESVRRLVLRRVCGLRGPSALPGRWRLPMTRADPPATPDRERSVDESEVGLCHDMQLSRVLAGSENTFVPCASSLRQAAHRPGERKRISPQNRPWADGPA
jgi:hypothetical protein